MTSADHVGHWIAILSLNDRSRVRIPVWHVAGCSDSIIGVTTHFRRYIVEASRAAGHGGRFQSSATEIGCVDSNVCGELSVWAELHDMPTRPNGEIRMAWQYTIHVMKSAGCKIGDRVVRYACWFD